MSLAGARELTAGTAREPTPSPARLLASTATADKDKWPPAAAAIHAIRTLSRGLAAQTLLHEPKCPDGREKDQET